MPTTATTGSDYYLLNKMLVYSSITATGTNTAVAGGAAGNELIDSAAAFTSALVGETVAIVLSDNVVTTALITGYTSATTLTLNSTIITATGKNYKIYSPATLTAEAEMVNNGKITLLNNSMLTIPNTTYPA